jgi:WD40 repeat protein
MPGGTRTIRVFVSSTFSDFQAEREALRRSVFPRLRELCRARSASFQAVDLRWGVSRGAAESHQTMSICLKEIDRCRALTVQPNFIAFLGDRYGWRPLPETIPADEFLRISQWLLGNRPPLNEMLQRAYRRDHNAVPPHYRIAATAPRQRRDPVVEHDLRLALRDAVTSLEFAPARRRRYMSSATEQEIAHRGLLDPDGDHRGVRCFFRTIDGLPQDKRARRFLNLHNDGTSDEEARALMRDLKDRLRENLPGGVRNYHTEWLKDGPSRRHIRQLCDDVYRFLAESIDNELSTHAGLSPLDREIEAHASFAAERQRVFVGRLGALQAVEAYLSSSSRHPLVIHGDSGSGKSALVSRVLSSIDGNSDVVFRFIGAAPGSTNVRLLLESLCRQLARVAGTSEGTDIPDYNTLVRDFVQRMTSHPSNRRLVLILDALDQLAPLYGAQTLNWLPRTLPDNVHVVVSTVPGSVLDVLRRDVPDTHRYELHGMSLDEGSVLLDLWLHDANRQLQSGQRSQVLDAFAANGLPLYLRFVFEEARLWPSAAPPPALASDVTGLIQGLFSRLSQRSNHGATLVNRSLAYLAAGRDGLTQDELLDVLSADGPVMREFRRGSPDSTPVDALPDIIWARLYWDLSAYLTERTSGAAAATLDFFHRQLREVVDERYLADARKRRHEALATYFTSQDNVTVAGGVSQPNTRKLSELPFQLAQAGLQSRLERTLTSFDFVRSKIAGVGITDLIEDFDRVGGSDGGQRPDLTALQEALRLSADRLGGDFSLLPSQLLGRLRQTTDPRIRRLLREAEDYRGESWLNPLTPSLTGPGGPLLGSVALDSEIRTASISPDGMTIVVGCQDGTIRLIDLERRVEMRRLAIHTGPVADVAYFPDQQRTLSACADDGVAVCDLSAGSHRFAFEKPGDRLSRLTVTRDGRRAVVTGALLDRESHIEHGIASLCEVGDGRELQRWTGKEGGFCAAAVSRDGEQVITGTSWGVIQLWSSQHEAAVHRFHTHDGSVLAIALADASNVALIASGDQSSGQYNVRLWDVSKWEELHNFTGHHQSVSAVAVTPDGRIGASGSDDRAIRVWDLERKRQLACLRGHSGRIRFTSLSGDGKRLVSTGGQSIFSWSLDTLPASQQLAGHMERVVKVSVSRDGRTAVSQSADGTVATWDLRNHRLKRMVPVSKEQSGERPLAYMPDGKHAIVSSRERTLSLVEIRTGRAVRQFARDTDVSVVAILDKGSRMLSDFKDFTLRLWDCATGMQLAKLNNGSSVAGLAVTADGRVAVSGTHYGRVHVWDLIRKKKKGELAHAAGGNWTISALAVTPDGAYALTGGDDTWIRVWHLKSRKCIAVFAAEDRTTCACATNDLFVAGSRNGAVHILRLVTDRVGSSPQERRPHSSSAKTNSESPDTVATY